MKKLYIFPIIILLAAGCRVSKNTNNQPLTTQSTNPPVTSTTTPSSASNAPAGWLTYSYQNLSFKYPADYIVEFQNKDTSAEFLTVRNQDLWIEIDYSAVNPSLDSSDITKYIGALMVDNQYNHYDLNTPVIGQKTVHIAGAGSMQAYDYDDYSFLSDGKYYRLDFSYHNDKVNDEKVRDIFIQNFKLSN